MKITNKYNLPEVIHKASMRDEYTKGHSHISVTSLINSPRIVRLRERHKDDMEMDVVDRIWSLLGTTVHKMLEDKEDNHITEQRLYCNVNGWTISGGVDVRHFTDEQHGLIDYKLTSVWSVMFEKPEWEQQLNCYAYLVHRAKNIRIDKLQICAILRDWKRSEIGRVQDYPRQPIVMVDIPVWDAYDQSQFVEERVRLHQDAERAEEWGDPLPLCTEEDRWARDKKWAVKKKGAKKAQKLCDSEEQAIDYIGSEPGYEIEFRPGKQTRCEGDYCGVAKWCEQFQAMSD